MNHRDRKDNYKRTHGKVKPPRQFILYVEGRNTEKSYFDLLKKANCKVIPVTKRGQGIWNCVDFVNDSDKAWKSLPKEEKEKYDKRWLVFDADGREDFDAGIKLARKKKFGVAFSNMCIEYWFLLHFYNHDGSAIPLIGDSHSAAQIKKINDFIKKYNKKAKSPVADYDSGNKKVEEDFFDLMMADDPVSKKTRIVSAFERAKIIHENKIAIGAEFHESVTTIYELLLELGVIEKKKDGYVLFRK
ncbi:MAG: RloB domain-containing protein [Bacteroidales bacterium]|nr:RloB domain-containing protein [Bacteroidales bacterium]